MKKPYAGSCHCGAIKFECNLDLTAGAGRCGVHPFSKGYLAMEPFNGSFHAVNIATLDDTTDLELSAAPIQYEDGRANCWDSVPETTSYL